jgi:hypothetical protein
MTTNASKDLIGAEAGASPRSPIPGTDSLIFLSRWVSLIHQPITTGGSN